MTVTEYNESYASLSTMALRKVNDANKKMEPWSLCLADLVDFLPVTGETISTWVKIGYFPASSYTGKSRKRFWKMSDVLGFLNKCIANEHSYRDHMLARKKSNGLGVM